LRFNTKFCHCNNIINIIFVPTEDSRELYYTF
jgi:hypothetical protein